MGQHQKFTIFPKKMKNLDDQKLKFFIAYETTTGRDIAEHLKNFFYKWNKQIPKNFSVEAFVDLDIPSGEDNERKYRYEKIKETDYFILILTPTAWEISQELKEETAAAKEMGKKILIVEMSGSIIPKELAYIHRLSKYPFEKKRGSNKQNWRDSSLLIRKSRARQSKSKSCGRICVCKKYWRDNQ